LDDHDAEAQRDVVDAYSVGFNQAGMRVSEIVALLEVLKVDLIRVMGFGT
jgi:hypothetical protein